MSISLNTRLNPIARQTDQNFEPKPSRKELRRQIIEIGKIDPNRASRLSNRIVTWNGTQKELDRLGAEGLDVSSLIPSKLLGGMQSPTDDILETLRTNLECDYEGDLSEENMEIALTIFKQMIENNEKGIEEDENRDVLVAELTKYEENDREELALALKYLSGRAEKKYCTGIEILAVIVACVAIIPPAVDTVIGLIKKKPKKAEK
ncbi:MAG: hypothetical protein AAGE99_02035 [Chlamydiota bacterium]